jgi:ubiquinone/menaquinone biosynthesis C-methylase UbiE
MSRPGFGSNQFKISQRKSWDGVAAGWQAWWKTIEKGGQKVSDKLFGLAAIKPRQKVLDIATGIGEPAVTAARTVGDKGHVTATDISRNVGYRKREPKMCSTASFFASLMYVSIVS